MIDLYTAATPNGWKASVTLEELGLEYNVHHIDLATGAQKDPDYIKINPNARIPTIVDRDNGEFAVFESGAIMLYLAEKTGRLIPMDVKGRSEVIQWLMFQMGGVGPMFGQLGFFYKFAGSEIEDPRPLERYVNETKRLMAVLEKQLNGRDWIVGDYSIADIAIAPWLRALDFYEAMDVLDWDGHPNLDAYLDRFLERPAVKKGLNIPPRD